VRTRFLAITCAVFALYALLFAHHSPGTGQADGYYSYLFARSLAFDGDVELKNDYALCGDPWGAGRDRGTGHPDNQAYIGPAVFWTPIIAIARRVVTFPSGAPARAMNGCEGPLVTAAMFSAVVLGALAVGLAYLAACRLADRRVGAVAALLFAVGSGLPHYVAVFPSSSHAYACFASALLIFLSLRAADRDRLSAYIPVGLAGGLLALQRLSDACLILIPLTLVATAARDRRFKITAGALVITGTLAGCALTLSLYRYLYGSPFVLPQGRHYLHPAHAHPLLVLFAPHGGLLYATPIAYLGLAGLVVGARTKRTRPIALAALGAFAMVLWVASSPLDWHGKGTFGARRLLVMTPVWIVFAAIALQRLAPFVRKHAVVLGTSAALLLFGVPVVGATLATKRGELPVERGSPQTVQYGNGVRAMWSVFDDRVGDVAILPAELVFSARFGLPMRSFRAATTDKFYRRSFHTLEWEPRTFEFTDETALHASTGLAPYANGVKLSSDAHEAKVVFAAGWPFATDAELTLDATERAEVSLAVGTFLRRCELGVRTTDAGAARTLRWSIPPGCFDSGLVELRVRESAPGRAVLLRLALDDTHVYPPSY
jgi:hypothetical protein